MISLCLDVNLLSLCLSAWSCAVFQLDDYVCVSLISFCLYQLGLPLSGYHFALPVSVSMVLCSVSVWWLCLCVSLIFFFSLYQLDLPLSGYHFALPVSVSLVLYSACVSLISLCLHVMLMSCLYVSLISFCLYVGSIYPMSSSLILYSMRVSLIFLCLCLHAILISFLSVCLVRFPSVCHLRYFFLPSLSWALPLRLYTPPPHWS